MDSVYEKKEDCCGCTACKNICPVNAINMEIDIEGFLYPIIDQSTCVNCGLCKKTCAFQNGYKDIFSSVKPSVYAVKHNDEHTRMSSTSGGAFTAISDKTLENEGAVIGVTFGSNWEVYHEIATSKLGRDMFKGSKYVQSNLRSTFKEIDNLLTDEKAAIFTGTPCQTAGLKKYLVMNNTDTEKLILCDNICHGTPSPLIWREHINLLEQKHKNKLHEYHFRSKIKGWHTEVAIFKNGKKEFNSVLSNSFKRLFFLHYTLRPACHNCKYTNLERPSDITIADFWGIEKTNSAFDDNRGVSLVIINSLKGNSLFESIKDDVTYIESNTVDCLQPQLQYPTKPSARRKQFWEDFSNNGYYYVIKKYADVNLKGFFKFKIRQYLKKAGIL